MMKLSAISDQPSLLAPDCEVGAVAPNRPLPDAHSSRLNLAESSSVLRPPSSVCRARSTGFSLIELLTVIAVIGILAAILFPSIGAARKSANRAKTKVQFNQWAAAIESFRSEYGYYPTFDVSGAVNPAGQSTTAGAPHIFHDVLAGKRRNGDALPAVTAATPAQNAEAQNRRRISFYSFGEAEFTPADSTRPNLLRDAFDNTAIVVLIDRNLDGRIDATDYPTLPSVPFPDGGSGQPTTGSSAADIPIGGLRSGVAFYAPDPAGTSNSPLFIFSWK